jgi:predicted nucleic acid-binding protein
MFLLGTKVISELHHSKPHQSTAVRSWAEEQPVQRLYMSSITVLEFVVVRLFWTAPIVNLCGGAPLPKGAIHR